MAIEQVVFSKAADIRDLIMSTLWFDSVLSQTNLYTFKTLKPSGTSGAKLVINIHTKNSSSSETSNYGVNANGITFYTTWSDDVTRTLQVTATNLSHQYAYKTKNGILFFSHYNPTQTDDTYFCWLLARTNDGRLAVAIQEPGGTGYRVQTAADGEQSPYIESNAYLSYSSVSNAAMGKWEDTPQIVMAPIPTHPAIGQSYIKGAAGFILSPFTGAGVVEIDGVKWATNGTIALNDED